MIFRKVTQAPNPSQQVGVVNVGLLLMSAAEAVVDFLMFPVQHSATMPRDAAAYDIASFVSVGGM